MGAGVYSLPEPRGDVSRLPKWAQSHLQLMEMRLAEANKKVTRLNGLLGFTESTYGDLLIPDDTHGVVFGASEANSLGEFSVRYDAKEKELRVSSGGGFGQVLSIMPQASNVVRIRGVGL